MFGESSVRGDEMSPTGMRAATWLKRIRRLAIPCRRTAWSRTGFMRFVTPKSVRRSPASRPIGSSGWTFDPGNSSWTVTPRRRATCGCTGSHPVRKFPDRRNDERRRRRRQSPIRRQCMRHGRRRWAAVARALPTGAGNVSFTRRGVEPEASTRRSCGSSIRPRRARGRWPGDPRSSPARRGGHA